MIYADVLREVEDLPESGDKYHALADVLMRGWWWLPGEKNDALFARIKDAAIKGKNDEVMEFIVTREDSHAYGKAKIDFIRDKQIPMLEEAGFVRALAREWFWLGYHYFRDGQTEKGYEAYETVQRILKPSDTYYSLVPNARKVEEKLGAEFKDVSQRSYLIGADAAELRNIDGELRYWSENAIGKGRMYACDRYIPNILRNSSRCDGRFFADLQLGESFTGTDGSTLCYVSDCETVETPCGTFEGCHLFTVHHRDFNGNSEYKSYYKSGVGIVKHSHTAENITDERLLKSYHIEGGEGLLPLAVGNTWEYTDIYPDDVMRTELRFTVSYADEGSVIVSSFDCMQRLKYDESSWLDMIEKIRNEYWQYKDGKQTISDVSDAIERANALAKTPMEKAHAEAAGSVARRIMDTDPTFNPGCKATGHWNFFAKKNVYKKDGAITVSHNSRWSFEWKGLGADNCEDEPLLFNDVYGILMDAANCIWSDEWRIGATPIVEYNHGTERIKTQITCEDGGSITTKAGTFDNCLKLSLVINDREGGVAYRGGNKEYYFAEGIGIVRTVNEYCSGARKAVYDLVSYTGTADGYMPVANGLVREYEAMGTTDGYVGGAKYTYVEEDGHTAIFADRTGIRVIPAPTTSYGYVLGEEIEDKLNDEGKLTEAHLQHALNNFNIMLHYLARPARHRNNAVRSIGICTFNMNLIESFGDGEVPPAWLGVYVWASMIRSAALFGNGDKEEGYKYLDCAIGACERWNSYKKEDLLETGNEQVFGGVKLIKGKAMLLLPDGTREPASYSYRLDMDGGLPYSILTMPSGWEWFNSVREEERFKEYIDRAHKQVKNS